MFKVIKLKSILITLVALLLAAVIVVVAVVSANKAAASAFSPLPKKTVVIDAGHGGADPGVLGVRTGVKESELNLKTALVLGEIFISAGYRAVQTRSNEGSTAGEEFDKTEDMAVRREIIRRADPEAVISIHMNKYDNQSRRGVQVFYTTEASRLFAEKLQKHLNQTMNLPTLGREFDPIKGDYFIADNGDIPSVIVECAFLSNPIDEALITDADYRLRLASEIEIAVARFLSENKESEVLGGAN